MKSQKPPSDESEELSLEHLLVNVGEDVRLLARKVDHETEVREKKLAIIDKGYRDLQDTRHRQWVGTIVVAVIALVAVFAAGRANGAANKSQSAVSAVEAARTQGKKASCLKDNQNRVVAGVAAANAARKLITIANAQAAAQGKSATDLVVANELIEGSRLEAMAAYEHRDCSSPKVIDLWYANPPAPDNEPCDPDGTGRCKSTAASPSATYVPPTTTTTVPKVPRRVTTTTSSPRTSTSTPANTQPVTTTTTTTTCALTVSGTCVTVPALPIG